MMQATWLEKYESWMTRKGTIVKGVPRRPMSPATVSVKVRSIKEPMKALGFLNGNGLPTTNTRKLREITIKELIGWFEKTFPDMGFENPTKWNYHVRGIHKLVDYVRFEVRDKHQRPVLVEDDIVLLKKQLSYAPEEPSTFDLSGDFLNRLDHKFLPWLKDRCPRTWALAAFLTYTGMRRSEVYGADVGLKTGTIIRLDDGRVRVTRKRSKGKAQTTENRLIPQAEQVLKDWIRIRKKLGLESKALFVTTQAGDRWDNDSQTLNRILRLRAKESGFFVGTCNENGDFATKELKFFSSHTIGRRSFITRGAHAGVAEEDGMVMSGHKDPRQYRKYVRVDPDSASHRVTAALAAYSNGNGEASDQVETGSLKDMIMTAIRELSPEDKKALGMDILKEVMS